jgi:hypothetical protein
MSITFKNKEKFQEYVSAYLIKREIIDMAYNGKMFYKIFDGLYDYVKDQQNKPNCESCEYKKSFQDRLEKEIKRIFDREVRKASHYNGLHGV